MAKYSRESFDGYTHRFIVNFTVDEDWRNDRKVTVYSDSGSKDELTKFIEINKSDKVKSFDIIHMATKEQDDRADKFLEEFLRG